MRRDTAGNRFQRNLCPWLAVIILSSHKHANIVLILSLTLICPYSDSDSNFLDGDV